MRSRISGLTCGGMMLGLVCARGPRGLEPLPPTGRVYYDDGPAFRDSVRMVVRDDATWTGVWKQASSTQLSPPPLPEIDFDHEMLLIVGAGRMAPGDQIRVDSAGVRGDYFLAVVSTIVQCRPLA